MARKRKLSKRDANAWKVWPWKWYNQTDENFLYLTKTVQWSKYKNFPRNLHILPLNIKIIMKQSHMGLFHDLITEIILTRYQIQRNEPQLLSSEILKFVYCSVNITTVIYRRINVKGCPNWLKITTSNWMNDFDTFWFILQTVKIFILMTPVTPYDHNYNPMK